MIRKNILRVKSALKMRVANWDDMREQREEDEEEEEERLVGARRPGSADLSFVQVKAEPEREEEEG